MIYTPDTCTIYVLLWTHRDGDGETPRSFQNIEHHNFGSSNVKGFKPLTHLGPEVHETNEISSDAELASLHAFSSRSSLIVLSISFFATGCRSIFEIHFCLTRTQSESEVHPASFDTR